MKAFPEIIGVGHCCQDYICSIENYPPEDSSTHILDLDDSQGGGGMATAMVAAARLGSGVGIIANLSDDEVGKKILKGLEEEGIDTSLIRILKGYRSSLGIVMVNRTKGSRTKFPYHDNLPDIDFDESTIEVMRHAKVLHLDGTRFPNAINAARIGKSLGLEISLDAASFKKKREENIHLLQMADIIIADEKYPGKLLGIDDEEQALLKMEGQFHPKILAMTLGKRGYLYIREGKVLHEDAYPVEAVDSTGAGDTFHGAFLSEYLRTKDTSRSLRFASAAAALKCTAPGGRAGIPKYEEVINFMNKFS